MNTLSIKFYIFFTIIQEGPAAAAAFYKRHRYSHICKKFPTNDTTLNCPPVRIRDFYGSNKGSGIIFFIFSVISDAGKNAVNNLVTHSVQYQHFILTLLYFSMIISSHLTLA